MRETLTGIGALLVLYTVLVLLQIAPTLPKTPVGWAIVILIGIPAYILMEWFGELLWDRADRSHIGTWVTTRTADKQFSWIRVGYRLMVALLVISLAIIAWIAFADYLSPVRQFLNQHFA